MDAGAFGLLVAGGDRVLCGSDCKWRECGVTGRLYAACSKRTARRSKKRKRFCVRKRIAPEYGRGRHRLARAWTSRTYASEVRASHLLQWHDQFHRQVRRQDEPAVSGRERNRDG